MISRIFLGHGFERNPLQWSGELLQHGPGPRAGGGGGCTWLVGRNKVYIRLRETWKEIHTAPSLQPHKLQVHSAVYKARTSSRVYTPPTPYNPCTDLTTITKQYTHVFGTTDSDTVYLGHPRPIQYTVTILISVYCHYPRSHPNSPRLPRLCRSIYFCILLKYNNEKIFLWKAL